MALHLSALCERLVAHLSAGCWSHTSPRAAGRTPLHGLLVVLLRGLLVALLRGLLVALFRGLLVALLRELLVALLRKLLVALLRKLRLHSVG